MSNVDMNIDNQRPLALVTGASSGIGLELAKLFAKDGYDVIAVAENAQIESAAREIESGGSLATPVQADLTTYDGVEAAWREVEAQGRPLDAIALNAGIGSGGPFIETDLALELKLVDLNCRSTVHLAKRAAKMLARRGRGKMLFTSSIAAIMPDPLEAVYGASKSFVYSFGEALRDELKEKGVSVTVVQPGPTETNFFHRANMDETTVGQDKKDPVADVAQQAFDALMAGKDHAIVGSLKTKIQAAVLSHLPEQNKAEAHKGMASPAKT